MPATALVTIAELERMPESCELINGVVVDMAPPGIDHGYVSANICALLSAFVKPRRLGRVLVEVGVVLSRDPDTVRAPDVAFISAQRHAGNAAKTTSYSVVVPELIVEVVSPDDRWSEVDEKADQWLASGAALVWIVDPRRRSVDVLSLAGRLALRGDDTIEGGPVLPGFSTPISAFFD